MEIGKRLRTLRAEKGFTQEKIADLLKIPQATYSNLENNKGKLDLKVVEKIASIYEIDVLDLLKEDGFVFNQKNKKGDNNGLVINQLSEKLIEQYELRLKEKDEIIADLKSKVL
ncbi:helix-turn-helix transcriptional regulator [Flavobacterium sp.]|uniref:helix-turn-helix domain-containing protein n=1 Tax=Flavobacterium sp. TaxID=239 RepID=UPI00286DB6DA|nr:helix-turn-helix transcriptional regulator [Flavobacterium sp.]